MGLLIDTSVLVQIERDELSVDDFLAGLAGEDAAIAAITASEMLVGVIKAAPESRRIRRESFVEYLLTRLPILPVDLAVARTHARLFTELQATGSMIGLHDLLIAATAISNEHAILTRNLREFAQVPGLEIRSQVS